MLFRITTAITEALSFLLFRNRLALLVKLALPAAVMIGLFFLPMASLLRTSMWTVDGTTLVPDFTFDNYVRFFTTPFYQSALLQSVQLAFTVAVLCLLLGYPLALILARGQIRFKALVTFLLVAPIFVSVVIRTFGWLVLLERQGVVNATLMGAGFIDRPLIMLNNMFGVTIGMVNVMLIFMVVPIVGSLAGVPRHLNEAAMTLGASRFKSWWYITWPLSAPGVIAGFLLVFVITLSSYVLPRLLGGASFFIVPTQIYRQVTATLDWPFAAAMGFSLLATALLVSALVMALARFAFPYYRQVRRARAEGQRSS